jgi:hypothetical protein
MSGFLYQLARMFEPLKDEFNRDMDIAELCRRGTIYSTVSLLILRNLALRFSRSPLFSQGPSLQASALGVAGTHGRNSGRGAIVAIDAKLSPAAAQPSPQKLLVRFVLPTTYSFPQLHGKSLGMV